MLKTIFILLLPIFLYSKTYVLTYFPLESHIVKKIAQKDVKIREISSRYINTYRKLPYSEISRFSNTKIFFHFGLDVEKEYEKILLEENPKLLVVDMSKGIEKIQGNPYFWTDPFLLRVVAKNVYDAFVSYDKYNADFYKENYERFLDEIDDTFLKIRQRINNSDVTAIYVFDDYWEYFLKRFRIETIKRDKRYLNISEIPSLVDFSQTKNINKLLFYRGVDYSIALSLSTNLNLEIVEDDIFGERWQFNLLNLSQNLFK
uniref:metal ABC transporter solute-binding protein, Zn/Mn family n=1 Tax=Aliarcobacter sp. TaxID=2321116 RepID=UPI004047228A